MFKKIQINKSSNSNTSWICSSLIVFLVVLILMISRKIEPFGKNSLVQFDCYNQFFPFLNVLYNKLKNGESLYYYWNSGLGSDYISNYLYQMASPLNLFVIFFPKNFISVYISFLIAIKIILSAGTFSFYLSTRDYSCNILANVTFSVAYAFSSYMLCYSHELMWLDAYYLLPIIVYGLELLFEKKNPFVYVLSLSFCAICNYYVVFFVAIFLIILFFLYEHGSFKKFICNGMLFVGNSLLAAGMAAYTLVVAYAQLSKSYVNDDSFPVHKWFGNIFSTVRYLFVFSKPVSITYDNNKTNIYCGMFSVVLFVLYFFIKRIHLIKKVKNMILFAFLILSMNESILNFIWHGFHIQIGVPNRFSFLLIFLILTMAYEAYCLVDIDDIKGLIIGAFITESLPMICYCFTDFDSYIKSKYVLLISILLFLIYIFLIISTLVLKNKRIIVVFACIALSEIYINSNYVLSHISGINNIGAVNDLRSDMDNIKVDDDFDFVRSEIVSQNPNLNACLDINGVAVFSSFYSKKLNDNLLELGLSTMPNAVDVHSTIEPMEDLFGIRYVIYSSDRKIYDDKSNYERITSNQNFNIYKNIRAFPIIFQVDDSVKNYSMDKNGNVFNNYNNLLNLMFNEGDICSVINPQYEITFENCQTNIVANDSLEIQYMDCESNNKKITVGFIIDDDGEYDLYFGNDSSRYKMNIEINDVAYDSEIADTCFSQYLGKRKKGDKIKITLEGIGYSSDKPSAVGNGVLRYIISRHNNNVIDKCVLKANADSFKIDSFEDGRISGSVVAETNKVLFSSIPYDECWHVYENGNELKTDNVCGFISLDLKKGNHFLEYKYIPKGLVPGQIITVASWFIFICIMRMKKTTNDISDSSNGLMVE